MIPCIECSNAATWWIESKGGPVKFSAPTCSRHRYVVLRLINIEIRRMNAEDPRCAKREIPLATLSRIARD